MEANKKPPPSTVPPPEELVSMFFKWADPSNMYQGFACLPYISGLTEPLTRLLRKNDIRVVNKALKTQQKPSTRKTIQNRCLGNTRFYCNQASFTFLSSSFFHACFYSQFFAPHSYIYIFACAPHFSFVKGYRLIAESLCF